MKKYFVYAFLFGALCSVASYATVNKNESLSETLVVQKVEDTSLGYVNLCEKDGTKCDFCWEAFRSATNNRVYLKDGNQIHWANEISQNEQGFTHRVYYRSKWYYFSVR